MVDAAPLLPGLMLLSAATSASIASYLVLRLRRSTPVPGARSFLLVAVSAAVWCLGVALVLWEPTLGGMAALSTISWLGMTGLAVGWPAFVLEYTRSVDAFRARVLGPLAAVPAATFLGLFVANDLLVHEVHRETVGSLSTLDGTPGPLLVVFVLYTYVVNVGTLALLAQHYREAGDKVRPQTGALLVAGALPFTVSIASLLGVTPFQPVDLTPFVFSVTNVVVLVALFRYELFRLVPVARTTLVEELTDGVLVVAPEGRIVDANPAASALLGTDDLVGRRVDDLRYDIGLDSPTDTTFSVEEADGTRHVEVTVSNIRTPGEGVTGSLVVLHDVTEQREREALLEETNERLDEFASVVSHDLRNPLTISQGYVDLLRERHADPDLEEIADANARMQEIIDDTLRLARLETQALDEEWVSLHAAAVDAWELVETGDATLAVDADASVYADPGRLQTLLENCFRNSVEHGSPDGGTDLTVSVGVLDDGFYVADDGVGVPDAVRDDLFEMGVSTDEDGTGFGLAIVQRTAQDHGWTVELVADDGARFEVRGVDVRS
ncbi:histidine kinase N-terminal 7TM domain-containing protein [Haloarchaeobius iranensis]|uniref:histidine kinase n=1 Tax=Haloarchaeobius iranensis TaxID=996166 RepID=A0A1G9SLS3_9EURY|nr:histidine kinase N-terminal 7TM domain-containing protein [Haloarchaeobius iranensis]SDM36438.1 PAS domain S-box-containing protein [Haloarchaeobius iranensis]